MTFAKPAPSIERVLERRIHELLRDMNQETKAFLYEHPDALRAVLGGQMNGHLERMRLKVPYEKPRSPDMDVVLALKALGEDEVLMSAATWTVAVDYRPKRDEVHRTSQLYRQDVGDTEDLEDLTEARRIVRAGGIAVRRLKRVWFDRSSCQSHVDGLIRLKGWSKVDARTLIAWSLEHRRLIEQHEHVVATAAPRLKRNGDTVVLSSSVAKRRDQRGFYHWFCRDDIGMDPIADVFGTSHSFLVEVPDDRDA